MAKKTARKGTAKKSAAKKSTAKKSAKKRSTTKRDLIEPKGDKRYVKRTARGRFKESDEVSRSLSTDQRKTAKKRTKAGYGDQGDRKTAAKKR